MPPKLRDNEDVLLDRLARLINVLESKEFGGGDTININREFENRADVDEPSDVNTASYFSTGDGGVKVTNTDDWVRLDFGFVAATVNLRFSDDIEVAFSNPNQRSSAVIPLAGTESPFTIGGDAGIDTAFMWVKQAETASDDPLMDIIAFR